MAAKTLMAVARWARTFAERMIALLPRAQQLHEEFLKRLPRGISGWTIGLHAAERQSLRAIGDAELEVVIECGEVCQVSFEQRGGRMLICGETDQGRPLHVIMEFSWPPRGNQMWEWEVITCYDPRTEPWRWSEDFKQQTCRCAVHVDY